MSDRIKKERRLKEKPRNRWCMVIDLNKCIGCQTCTVACKQHWTEEPGMEYMWWNIVNTYPGKGTPKNWHEMGGGWENNQVVLGQLPTEKDFGEAWEFNFDEVFYSGNSNKISLKPKGPAPQWGPNWDEDEGGGIYPNGYYFYLPRTCNHCSNPACMEACPTKSVFIRKEDGVVLIDEETCKGIRMCQRACPYKRIYYNKGRVISQKCIGCFPRIEQDIAPACVRQCPGRVRHFGYLDDKNSQVHQLISRWKVALPLYPEYETKPNVYYVPPLLPTKLNKDGTINLKEERVPRNFLRKLFGKEVDRVLETIQYEKEKKKTTGKSELMDLLISRKWKDMFTPFDKSPGE